MKILDFIIVCICFVIIGAFFAPWVKGAGSLVKPVDDAAGIFHRAEPTGILRTLVKTVTGTVDAVTGIILPVKLKRALSGYQMPISEETKQLRPAIYLMYLLPLAGFICAVLSISANRKKSPVFIAFLIAAAAFALLFGQVEELSREGVFIKIEACYGFTLTLYSFLALGATLLIKWLTPAGRYRHNSKAG